MKYYVNSGSFQFIIEATDEDTAVQKFIDQCNMEDLGKVICVNQQGFNHHHSGDVYIETTSVIA